MKSQTGKMVSRKVVTRPLFPKVLLAAFILLGIDILFLIVASSTNQYSVASTMASLTFYAGLLVAVLMGAGWTQFALRAYDKKARANSRQPNATARAILGVVVFLVTGFIGLVVAVVIYFMTSDRACQLSSSKCY